MSNEIIFEQDFSDDFFVSLVKLSEKDILGVQHTTNRIYRIDLENNQTSYFKELPVKSHQTFKLFQTAIRHEDKIYFLPFNSEVMAIYSIPTGEIDTINITNICKETKYGKYMNAFVDKDILVLIPYGAKEIIQYDLKKEKIFRVDDISKHSSEKDLYYSFIKDGSGKIMISSMMSNRILCYEMKSGRVDHFFVGDSDCCYSYITYFNNYIWLLFKNKPGILKYNPDTMETIVYSKMPDGYEFVIGSCFDAKNVYKYHNLLYCFPGDANMAIKIDLTSGEMTEILALKPYCQNQDLDHNRFIFDGSIMDGQTIYLNFQKKAILSYNINDETVREYRINLYPDPLHAGLEYLFGKIGVKR